MSKERIIERRETITHRLPEARPHPAAKEQREIAAWEDNTFPTLKEDINAGGEFRRDSDVNSTALLDGE